MTPEDALDKLLRIARGESRGSFMSIPARPDVDADLVLATALRERAALQAQVDAITRERDGLRIANNLTSGHVAEMVARAEAAEREAAALREALERVTRLHDERCGGLKPNHPDLPGYVCDCGRDEARAALSPIPVSGEAKEASPFDDGTECMHFERGFGNRQCMRCFHVFPKEEWTK